MERREGWRGRVRAEDEGGTLFAMYSLFLDALSPKKRSVLILGSSYDMKECRKEIISS